MTPEERDKFINAYKRAKTVLNKINQYASNEVRRQGELIDSPKGFETPNWQYLQAWYAGYRQAMRIMADVTRTK